MSKNKSEEEYEHTFASKENHYPLDQLLRRHGFKIYSRKKDEEPVWERKGVKFKQSRALLLIPKSEVQSAKARN